VHNLIVWKRLIPGVNVTVLTNEDGPVFHNVCWEQEWGQSVAEERHVRTTKGVQASRLHATDAYGKLMNGHRTQVAALVHQYDRCPSITHTVRMAMKPLPARPSTRPLNGAPNEAHEAKHKTGTFSALARRKSAKQAGVHVAAAKKAVAIDVPKPATSHSTSFPWEVVQPKLPMPRAEHHLASIKKRITGKSFEDEPVWHRLARLEKEFELDSAGTSIKKRINRLEKEAIAKAM